jgi:hypothetical protein
MLSVGQKKPKVMVDYKYRERIMRLFNLMDNELAFLKQGLALNEPLPREYGAVGAGCEHCESVCASGCGANCSGQGRS